MKIAIIGNADDKWTFKSKALAKAVIRQSLEIEDYPELVSGGCHLGGVDIWAEEFADVNNLPKHIFKPKKLQWEGGYKQRNILIAKTCDKMYVIVARDYPSNYTDRKFGYCYHCNSNRPPHVKSGACWTGMRALAMGKIVKWVIVSETGWNTYG